MIVDKFYVGEAKPWGATPRGVLRMSGSQMCTRRAGYQYLRYPEDSEEVPGSKDFHAVVLEEGNVHELEVVRRLQKDYKIWNFGAAQTWTALRYKGLLWRGHPDLFIEIDNVTYGAEIKSTRDSLFSKYADASEEVLPGRFILKDQTVLHDATFPYMGQIQLYLHSDKMKDMGVEQWFLFVKNRDTGSILECLISKDEEYLESILSRWSNFWALMSAERLPDRNFEKSSTQCKLCPFNKQCWGSLAQLPSKTVTLEDSKLVEAAALWREGKELGKKSETRIDLAKLVFLNTALEKKANRLKVDELDITISNRSRESLNSSKVEALLKQLVKDEVILPEEVNEFYTSTEYSQLNIRDGRVK